MPKFRLLPLTLLVSLIAIVYVCLLVLNISLPYPRLWDLGLITLIIIYFILRFSLNLRK
ncbi:MAG: hypothetical protein JJT94_16565 [Bernardetiaceae bacterium]|nr:hypothetical protein [Bernardetiaceae bacterium]